jgi:DNA-directed RNA polymerase specialized sigma24 family protein
LPESLHEEIKELYSQEYSLAAISQKIGFNTSAIRKALVKCGVEIRSHLQQCKLISDHPNWHLLTYQGKTMKIADWARELGIPSITITMRLKRGWPVEKALATPLRKWG